MKPAEGETEWLDSQLSEVNQTIDSLINELKEKLKSPKKLSWWPW
jgi:hypothetical protein